ncbi:glycosyltransferase [Tenacibaculum sp. C7A-26P2]|uniref:glycosyltransferase n=1 Tax=Tenacibaculum sp. C7A-26P2 TaxID=3447504 RepID=UPI003F834EAC
MPIKSGGGQQVASNFVIQLLKKKDVLAFFLVTKDTYIHKVLQNKQYENMYAVKKGLLKRLSFQLFKLGRIIKKNNINIIYTMFGPGLNYRGVKSVTGCAYSNLFFPEIKFWQGYSGFELLKLKLIDKYRLTSTLKSDYIVFENESMLRRAVNLFNYPMERTKLILPSISAYPSIEISEIFEEKLKKIDSSKFNFLMLTGWHKNKNIEIVPYVLSELSKLECKDIDFIITVPEDHPESLKLKEVAKKFSVKEKIKFIGSVKPEEVPLLFKEINAVALFSLLESFSNNIIESWCLKKPLFISDEEWSRAICGDAAIYVDRINAVKIAEKIISYRKDPNLQKAIKENAKKVLKLYPNPEEKVDLQLDFLKEVE